MRQRRRPSLLLAGSGRQEGKIKGIRIEMKEAKLLLVGFFFCFFGHAVRGILVPRSGVEPAPLHWERKVLTIGPPGKSLLLVVDYTLLYIGN